MQHSSLTVIQNFIGDEINSESIKSLQMHDIEALSEELNFFYENHLSDINEHTKEPNYYAGGWIAGNPDNSISQEYLFNSLLYFPKAIIHDPIANVFDKKVFEIKFMKPIKTIGYGITEVQMDDIWRSQSAAFNPSRTDNLEVYIKDILYGVNVLKRYEKLINAGLIVPLSQWRIIAKQQEKIFATLRFDLRDNKMLEIIQNSKNDPTPRSDHLRGLGLTNLAWAPGEYIRSEVQDVSLYLSKTIMIAADSGSVYSPSHKIDSELFLYKLEIAASEISLKSKIETIITPGLISSELPFVGQLSQNTLLEIRKNSDAFESWRSSIRSATNLFANLSPANSDFQSTSKMILEDTFMPEILNLKSKNTKASIFKSSVKEGAIDFSVGTAAFLGTSMVKREAIMAGILAAGLSGITKAAIKAVFKERNSSVLFSLIRK